MIQELKRIPITFNGVDGWEILVEDDGISWDEPWVCENCMYRDWPGDNITWAPCSIVHQCALNHQTYFKFEPI